MQLHTDIGKGWRRRVFHLTILVKDLVYATQNLRKREHTVSKLMECRIIVHAFIASSVKKPHNGCYGLKRTAKVEYLVLLKMRSLKAYALDRFAHVKEELQWEIIALLLQSTKLARLPQHGIYDRHITAKRHLIDLILAELTKTIAFQQRAYLAKLYLVFKVAWINHSAKLHIFTHFSRI